MELPKVNIAVAASAVVAIVSTLGGGIWYASSQASIIEALQSDLETLTIENNAVDRTNLIRDVERNQENIQELLDILSEFYDDMEDYDQELWTEIDALHTDVGSLASNMMEIIKLQSRIAILEKTVEFTRRMDATMDPDNNFSGIKLGLQTGKTISALSKDIGRFFDATDAAKKTLQQKGVSAKSANSTALDRWANFVRRLMLKKSSRSGLLKHTEGQNT